MKRVALIAALLAASACSQPSPGPTRTPTPDPLTFTQCMRGQGIAMADPDPDTGRPKPGEGVDPDSATYQAAFQDCAHLLPGSESSDPKDLAKYQAYAECMRENGMPDFPDPQPGEQGHFGELDRTNPNFGKANQACQDVLADVNQ